MKRLIFVDDEPRVLDALRRMLYRFRSSWTMDFVTSGAEALQHLSRHEYDVLVTDVHMPEMDGVQLLEQVITKYPGVVRVVLSGTADYGATLPAVKLAHQYLVKPCDADKLLDTLQRAMVLRFLPDHPALQRLVSSIPDLPSLPAIYRQLVALLESDDVSTEQVGAVLSSDVAMTAKILQLVNSAYFGVQREVRDPASAVVYLGIDTVKALVITASIFSVFDQPCGGGLSVSELNEHSLAVGTLAKRIARDLHLSKEQTEDVFSGALLHDIGKLAMAAKCPDLYREVATAGRKSSQAQIEAELRTFSATHAEVGAYLLWLWGLPDSTVKIVALHHEWPDTNDAECLPTIAVQLADAVTRGEILDRHLQWLREAGLESYLAKWQEASMVSEKVVL